MEDAFGRWIPLEKPEKQDEQDAHVRSVLAQQVQSYEVQIMLALLPVLQNEPDIRVLSWLHDGITIKYQDIRRLEQRINRLKRAINQQAAAMNIPTYLTRE